MKLWAKISALVRRRTLEREMAEEMRVHLEMLAERKRAEGMSAEEARWAARREFGGVEQIKERCREQRGWQWLEDTARDVRYAVRQLTKSPGFAAIVILTLAFGIGATTAIYSVVDRLLLNPIPGPAPDQLVQIGQWLHFVGEPEPQPGNVAPPVREALEGERDFFAEFTWCDLVSLERKHDGFTDSARGGAVAANFFRFLGVRPEIGRTFASDEAVSYSPTSLARDTTIILSHWWWTSQFGGDPAVLGKTIELGGRHLTVVGVMPGFFSFPERSVQFWVPVQPQLSVKLGSIFSGITILARLREGTSTQQAQAFVDTVAARLRRGEGSGAVAGSRRGVPPELSLWCAPLRVAMRGGHKDREFQDLRKTLLGYFAAIGLVLLIVCANTANLSMARMECRRHELATRMALGASRGRLVRQLLAENLVLAGAGGLAGLLVAGWGIKLLTAFNTMPRLRPVELDGAMLGTAMGVSLLTGLVFGLVPAWQGGKTGVNDGLKQGGAGIAGAFSRRYRSGLVVSEVALAIVLLVGAGLMVRNVIALLRVSPGYDPEKLLSVWVDLAPRGTLTPERAKSEKALVDLVLSRLAALPGVDAAGMLGDGLWNLQILPQGRDEPVFVGAASTGVGESDGLRVARVPLRAGRYLDREDLGRSAGTVLVNESMAHLCWPGESAVGKTFRTLDRFFQRTFRVVGVVGDVRSFTLDEVPSPTFYRPYTEETGPGRLLLRTKTNPGGLVAAVVRELKATVPVLREPRIASEQERFYESTSPQRTYRNYLVGFAGLGLALAAMGIYGTLAFSVNARTREIGIRTALGASPHHVQLLILREGVRLAAAGAGIGLIAAAVLTRVLQQQYLKDAPLDPWVLLGASAVLGAAVLLACWLPARRAARVDPMVALRCE